MDLTGKTLDIVIAVVIVFALLPVIITSSNGTTWGAVNLGGTVYDLSWFPFVLLLVIIAGIVILVYRHYKHKG